MMVQESIAVKFKMVAACFLFGADGVYEAGSGVCITRFIETQQRKQERLTIEFALHELLLRQEFGYQLSADLI